MSNSLRGKKISDSFSKLVQVIEGVFYDGLGNPLTKLNGATAGIGPQGVQGLRGAIGFSGIGGTQGFQGFQGWQGLDGTQGYQGNIGFQGLQGYEGPQGFQGYEGFQGSQGFQGFQGSQGFEGPQGWQGFEGAQGWQGFEGAQGWQGFQGAQGWQGPQGVEASRDFLSVVLSGGATTGPSSLSLYNKSGTYNRNLTHDLETIFLNPSSETDKTYQVLVSFFVYDMAVEPYTFRFKTDNVVWGLEIGMGTHAVDDFSYNVYTYSDIIVSSTPVSLEFWRTSTNTINPSVQGFINIIEV
jgi:hypothetical protein